MKRLRPIFVYLIILMFGVSVSGCAGARYYSDPEFPIRLKVNQKFTISLDSNPTTGYKWQLGSLLDESKLKLTDSKYIAAKTKLIGAGGKELWVFKAAGKGKAEVHFEYIRPWESGEPAAKQEVFSVIID